MAADTYTTRSGDTWDVIALRTLGSELHMDLLVEANPEHRFTMIFDSGEVLNVPAAPEPARPASLPPWKRIA